MRQRALGLAVAIIGCFALVSASGAATTKTQNVTKINVSTRAAVVHYLRSIHVNAKHAVIQRGFRNYAGAHCPGTRWTCAKTKHTVVQIAKRGGQNRFLCKGSKCVVVQISGVSHGVYTAGRIATASPSRSGGNSGFCVKTGSGTLSGGGQTCSIIQSGSSANTAGVYEVTSKMSVGVQTVQFAATIQQQSSGTGSAGNNTACVTQGISQTASTSNTNTKPLTVSLEATQTIVIQQATLKGNNSAVNGANPTTGTCNTSQTLSQFQNQTSIVSTNGDITQNMNPDPNGPTDGNASIDIEQNTKLGTTVLSPGAAIGTNSAAFSQKTNQQAVANTKAGKSVTQLQNSTDGDGVATPFSGIVGTINQDSKGQSTATVTQDEIQCEDAANTSTSPALTGCSTTSDAVTGITVKQTQNGPVGLFTPPAKSTARVPAYHKGNGKSQQTSAVAPASDIFNLTQTSSQYADQSNGNTTVLQSNIMQGDCASSGNGSATGGTCTASQQATLNGVTSHGTTSDGYTAGSISNLTIKCTNGHDSCDPTPPPDPTLTATPPVNTDGETNATSASFTFTDPARDATFNCTLDTVTINSCGSPSVHNGLLEGTKTYSGLDFGPHTFTVTATDSSGNESGTTATFTWTVVPPDPTITASSEPTNPDFFGTSDTFQFTDTADPNVHYRCTLDGTTTGCNGGSITYTSTDLAPGSHTFSVQAFDTTDTYGSLNSATYTWTILALSVSALGGDDGSSAGWACQPGGPIALTVGSTPYDPETDIGTFAQVAITDAGGTAINGLTEPTFTTDNYAAGSPRFVIDLSNGDSLWGYPPNAGLNGTDFAWSINNGNSYLPWGDVQTAEAGKTITDAVVIADGDQDPGTTDKIGSLQFNGTTYNSGTCS